jgi:hypothetical protein
MSTAPTYVLHIIQRTGFLKIKYFNRNIVQKYLVCSTYVGSITVTQILSTYHLKSTCPRSNVDPGSNPLTNTNLGKITF